MQKQFHRRSLSLFSPVTMACNERSGNYAGQFIMSSGAFSKIKYIQLNNILLLILEFGSCTSYVTLSDWINSSDMFLSLNLCKSKAILPLRIAALVTKMYCVHLYWEHLRRRVGYLFNVTVAHLMK